MRIVSECCDSQPQGRTYLVIEFGRFNSGDVKGTITDAVRYHFAPNDVRRHRLISISYISLLPCHGTAKWYGREQDGVGGSRKESDNPYYAGVAKCGNL